MPLKVPFVACGGASTLSFVMQHQRLANRFAISWRQPNSLCKLRFIPSTQTLRYFTSLRQYHVDSTGKIPNESQSCATMSILLPSEEDMEEVGAFFSSFLLRSGQCRFSSGLVIFLNGDLGRCAASLNL